MATFNCYVSLVRASAPRSLTDLAIRHLSCRKSELCDFTISIQHSTYGGVHSHGGTPTAGWFMLGKIPLKWMITRGSPMTQETNTYWLIDCQDFRVLYIMQMWSWKWLPIADWQTSERVIVLSGWWLEARDSVGIPMSHFYGNQNISQPSLR